eukprot:5369597-Amphidinium_carterae.2
MDGWKLHHANDVVAIKTTSNKGSKYNAIVPTFNLTCESLYLERRNLLLGTVESWDCWASPTQINTFPSECA